MSVLKIRNQYGNWSKVPVVDGKDGISLLSGELPPYNNMGNDDDLYLNLNNGNIYKKVSGIWEYFLNIKGQDGVPGKDGKDGVPGKDGKDVVEGLTFKRDESSNIWVKWS